MRGEKVDEINVSRALKNTYFVNTFYLFIWKIMAQQDKFRTNQFRAKNTLSSIFYKFVVTREQKSIS